MTRASGQLMSHVAFATFLEENAVDIKSPVGADLSESSAATFRWRRTSTSAARFAWATSRRSTTRSDQDALEGHNRAASVDHAYRSRSISATAGGIRDGVHGGARSMTAC